MAKAYIVIKNGTTVVGRFGSKALAQAEAELLRDKYTSAAFEFGKLDKRLYNTLSPATTTPVDEVL